MIIIVQACISEQIIELNIFFFVAQTIHYKLLHTIYDFMRTMTVSVTELCHSAYFPNTTSYS